MAKTGRGMTWEGTWLLSSLKNFFRTQCGERQLLELGTDFHGLDPRGCLSHLSARVGVNLVDLDQLGSGRSSWYLLLDWYYTDPARIAERIAAYPGLMTLPVPFETSGLSGENMDSRVAEHDVDFPRRSHLQGELWLRCLDLCSSSPKSAIVVLHDEVQKVFTGDAWAGGVLPGDGRPVHRRVQRGRRARSPFHGPSHSGVYAADWSGDDVTGPRDPYLARALASVFLWPAPSAFFHFWWSMCW